MSDPETPTALTAARKRIERIAALLDSAVGIPGTRLRFGLDSVLGLIPGVGDVLGLALGGTILYEGVRAGAPRALILRMLGNSAIDALGGLVPVLGDVFDLAFKSNRRNARLLLEHLDSRMRIEARAERGGRLTNLLIVSAALAGMVALLVFAVYLLLA